MEEKNQVQEQAQEQTEAAPSTLDKLSASLLGSILYSPQQRRLSTAVEFARVMLQSGYNYDEIEEKAAALTDKLYERYKPFCSF